MNHSYSYFGRIILSLLCSVAFVVNVKADDTDIYFNTGNSSDAGTPLVMLTLDYRPNLANALCKAGADCDAQLGTDITKFLLDGSGLTPAPFADGDQVVTFDALRAVYASVFSELEGVKVGLMLSSDNNCQGASASGPSQNALGCSNGGYVLSGFREFELEKDSDGKIINADPNGNKAAVVQKMLGIPIPQGNVGHPFQGKEVYFELFQYLTGGAVYNGHVNARNFGNDDVDILWVDYPNAGWDTSIESPSILSPIVNYEAEYQSPLGDVGACSRLSVINLLFQVSNQEDESDDAIRESALGGEGLSDKTITFPDMIKAMNDFNFSEESSARQGVSSYFISTNVNTTTNNYAAAGGTGSAISWSTDAAGLVKLREDLKNTFNEVLAVSTTFVSIAVPVNVFNRASLNENLFTAIFTVDRNRNPGWSGNLKKLRLNETIDANGDKFVTITDADGDLAFNPQDGRIKYSALTYWTDSAALPPVPRNPTGEDKYMVTGKDGRFVTRGGAGQKIPGYIGGQIALKNGTGARQMFTGSTDDDLIPLNADTSTATALAPAMGLADAGEAEKTLVWARGNDPDTGDVRNWLLNDVLHSRPLPINYGARGGFSDTNPDIRILMGTNAGFMHMFQNSSSGGSESGVENWAFMPRELLPLLPRLRENDGSINPPHPYGVDGAATVYLEDNNNDNIIGTGDKAWAFFGLRRGGRNYYGMDITNPDNPSLMWVIRGGTGAFGNLALTFSAPTPVDIQFGSSKTPALIFGGGYNGGWDPTNQFRIGKDAGSASDSIGNSIYIVNAETGALIKEFTHPALVDSIPSTVSVLDSNGDGLEDRAYVGDTGGNVWRVDFPSASNDNRSSWAITHFASLGGSEDRRFFHQPDIVQTKNNGAVFDAIVIGSGDRADPLETSVNNAVFMIKDTNVSSPPISPTTVTESDLGDITDTCITQDVCTADLTKGWKLSLEANGEKSLARPVTVVGAVMFTTYVPAGAGLSSCEPNEGTGFLYRVSLFDGSPIRINAGEVGDLTKSDRKEKLAVSGIPPEYVVIDFDLGVPPGGAPEKFDVGKFWRTFWYEKNVD